MIYLVSFILCMSSMSVTVVQSWVPFFELLIWYCLRQDYLAFEEEATQKAPPASVQLQWRQGAFSSLFRHLSNDLHSQKHLSCQLSHVANAKSRFFDTFL
jgi:hypothetical protein